MTTLQLLTLFAVCNFKKNKMKLPNIKFYLPALVVLLMGGIFLAGVNQANAVGDAYFP